MARHFGSLGVKVRGIITYTISPFEQRAFAGAFKYGIPNVFRRINSQLFRVAPPFVIGYLIYDWANQENARLSRKDPKEFANDC